MIVRRPLLVLAAALTGAAPPPAGDPPIVRAADEAALPGDTRPWWVCRSGMAAAPG